MRLVKSFLLILCFLCLGAAQASALNIRTPEDLEQFAASCEGKQVLVVNFYASWCGPCRMELPDLIAVRKQYPESQVQMIGINLDESSAAMNSFNKSAGINFPTIHDSGAISQYVEVESIPFNIVFAKSGEAIYAQAGVIDRNTLVEVIEHGLKN